MKGTYRLNDDFYIHSDNMSWFSILCYYIGYFLGQVLVICLGWYFLLDIGGFSWDEKVKITTDIFIFFSGLVDILFTGLQEFPDLSNYI